MYLECIYIQRIDNRILSLLYIQHRECLSPTDCIYGVPRVYPECIYSVPIVYLDCRYSVSRMYRECIWSVSRVYLECIPGVYSPPTLYRPRYTPDTPERHSIYTPYTLCTHSRYILDTLDCIYSVSRMYLEYV